MFDCNLITSRLIRYPTKDKIQEHVEIGNLLSTSPLFKDSSFKLGYNQRDGGMLSPQGQKDALLLGQRMSTRYSSLLSNTKTTSIKLTSSNSTRTLETAYYFLEGSMAAGKEEASLVYKTGIVQKDKTLDADNDPNHACLVYEVNAKSKFGAKEQVEAYQRTYLDEMTRRVSQKLGLEASGAVTGKQVLIMQDICAYQYANQITTQVCQLFNQDDFIHYERSADLEKYYLFGYEQEINRRLGCSQVSGLVKDALASDTLQVSLRFGHAESIMPLIVSLGLFKDIVPISNQTTDLEFRQKKWVTSRIVPFLANVVFEVYTSTRDRADELAVRMLVNEVPTSIPHCSRPLSNGLCMLTDFIKGYSDILGCNFDVMCGNKQHTFGGWSELWVPDLYRVFDDDDIDTFTSLI